MVVGVYGCGIGVSICLHSIYQLFISFWFLWQIGATVKVDSWAKINF
jgi:hypothetical protein